MVKRLKGSQYELFPQILKQSLTILMMNIATTTWSQGMGLHVFITPSGLEQGKKSQCGIVMRSTSSGATGSSFDLWLNQLYYLGSFN